MPLIHHTSQVYSNSSPQQLLEELCEAVVQAKSTTILEWLDVDPATSEKVTNHLLEDPLFESLNVRLSYNSVTRRFKILTRQTFLHNVFFSWMHHVLCKWDLTEEEDDLLTLWSGESITDFKPPYEKFHKGCGCMYS